MLSKRIFSAAAKIIFGELVFRNDPTTMLVGIFSTGLLHSDYRSHQTNSQILFMASSLVHFKNLTASSLPLSVPLCFQGQRKMLEILDVRVEKS